MRLVQRIAARLLRYVHRVQRARQIHSTAFRTAKARKLQRLVPILRRDMPHTMTSRYYDFLSKDLRIQYGIEDTGPESANDYDPDALALFARHAGGLILDVGAGYRSTYFDDVVNFEVAAFASTDVRGVAESLPFVDGSFDAVISIAVLEHVRDPFRAAGEIVRVLKPGGELMCCVPFLQPVHGYPHHYYNMTHEGLRNLFDRHLTIDRITTPDSTLPIWSISWILRSWSAALPAAAKSTFLELQLGELIADPNSYLEQPWVRQLPIEKNLELASACVLFGRKPARAPEFPRVISH